MPRVTMTRERILMSAIDCFARDGYKRCTMQQIAEQAGIKTSSVYKHFAGKEQILTEVFNYYRANFGKYQTPVSEVLNAARNRPASKLIPMMFFRFGGEEERATMLKIAKIVMSMMYKSEQAREVYWDLHMDKSLEYINTVMFSLIMSGRIRPIDYAAFSFHVNAFAQMMLTMALHPGLDQKLVEKQYVDGIRLLGKSIEFLETQP